MLKRYFMFFLNDNSYAYLNHIFSIKLDVYYTATKFKVAI